MVGKLYSMYISLVFTLYTILLLCYVLYVLVQLKKIQIHSISPVSAMVLVLTWGKHRVSLPARAVAKIQQQQYPKDGGVYRRF